MSESDNVILLDLIRRVAVLETGHAMTAEATKNEVAEMKEEMKQVKKDVSEIKGLIMQIHGGRKVLITIWWLLGLSLSGIIAWAAGLFSSVPLPPIK